MIKKINLRFCITITILMILTFLMINFSSLGVSGLKNQIKGAEILDFNFGFSNLDVYNVLTQLDEVGRNFYRQILAFMDTLFPITYSLTVFCWISYLLNRLSLNKYSYSLLILPIITLFADLFENYNIIRLINNFPAINSRIVNLASISNIVKWVSVILMVFCLIGLVFMLWFKEKKRGGKK